MADEQQPRLPNKIPQKSTQGAIDQVPCPWCGWKLDFRDAGDESSGGVGWGEAGLENGAKVDCDNPLCRKTSRIIAKQTITIIRLQPVV